MDHLTFKGGGGGEELVSVIIFFSLASGAGNFFRAVHAFFLYPFTLHDFFTVKALQGIFFSQISPPPQKSNGPPLS